LGEGIGKGSDGKGMEERGKEGWKGEGRGRNRGAICVVDISKIDSQVC